VNNELESLCKEMDVASFKLLWQHFIGDRETMKYFNQAVLSPGENLNPGLAE
jgi:hypothetical protein